MKVFEHFAHQDTFSRIHQHVHLYIVTDSQTHQITKRLATGCYKKITLDY